MRKPRDIDSELNALDQKAKQLRARKVTQLGELVIGCDADALPVDVLAGALLAATASQDVAEREVWRRWGAAFFCRGPRGSTAGAVPARAGVTSAGSATAAARAEPQP